MYVGLTGLFGLVPLILFGLWGGAIADAFDRRKVLLVSTIGLIATTSAFAVQALLQFHNVWRILRDLCCPAILLRPEPARTQRDHPDADPQRSATGRQRPVHSGEPSTSNGTSTAGDGSPSPSKPSRRQVIEIGSIVDGFRYTWAHKILLMSFVVDLIAMVFGMPRALYPEIANINFGGPAGGV